MTKTWKHCHARLFIIDENLKTLPYIRLFNIDENLEPLPYKAIYYWRKPENIAIQGYLILTKTWKYCHTRPENIAIQGYLILTKTWKHCHTRLFNIDENLKTLPYIRLFNIDENLETLPYKAIYYWRKPENIAIQWYLILAIYEAMTKTWKHCHTYGYLILTQTWKHCHTRLLNIDENLKTLPYNCYLILMKTWKH